MDELDNGGYSVHASVIEDFKYHDMQLLGLGHEIDLSVLAPHGGLCEPD
jgi:hypothetical protein